MVEWLVIVYDKPEADRLSCRQQHIAAVPNHIETGKITNVGAIYKDVDEAGTPKEFIRSTYNIIADSREEILEFLKKDIYYKNGIWDLDSVVMHPYGCFHRVSKK